ncbi:hypothetical protein A1OE_1022 [Candidatus Endolissoclinum faulkneri L2]|uniref:Uncharacterized protein n=1 Tax=Candidatus Endolissoclinum faulkneri L2 TaxID=1193729 RepID=K7ZD54_9PROT|nr:hypothetical protein A1OE_1022 [Candidatus Endolissoclinum faulkneri L2]
MDFLTTNISYNIKLTIHNFIHYSNLLLYSFHGKNIKNIKNSVVNKTKDTQSNKIIV